MAVAISGCVITDANGAYIHYKKKCDKCGYLELGQPHGLCFNSKYESSFRCPKCKYESKVLIKSRA